ncbi:MAG TPA: alanine racemase [Ideonella sp.]|jgi:D-serine deaminase-like pyridoxal phosphate-dependent protein|nr:alanine racemase [Ideonella sp.]
MKRRHVLFGASAAALGAAVVFRPSDQGGAHDAYFRGLGSALAGLPAMPTLVVDRARLRANLAQIRRIAHANLPLRVVVKSLPALGLIDEAMTAWATQRAMLFNAPQLALVARERPATDVLLGKPLPASAARWALEQPAGAGFDPHRQVQWLIDTPARLAEYRELARARGQAMRVNIEIDVGLHRGGVESEAELAAMLDLLRNEPLLEFAGLMGYDAHLAAVPDLAGNRASAQAEAQRRYAMMLGLARQRLTDPASKRWTLNAAGSPTFHLHDDQHAPNELSVGSATVKPSDFDKPSLSALEPAAFIATPVLKTMEQFRLPVGAETVSQLAGWYDVNQRRALAIHGGHWLADPVSPPGVSASSLYGPSSNQQVMVTSPSTTLVVGDWLFLRPKQSEAVFLQFGAIVVVDKGEPVERWPVFPASA